MRKRVFVFEREDRMQGQGTCKREREGERKEERTHFPLLFPSSPPIKLPSSLFDLRPASP
jgi:hypothetical protein